MTSQPALSQQPESEARSSPPATLPATGVFSEGSAADIQKECERLRQVVEQLISERNRLQERVTALTAERDDYRRSLHAWAREQVTEEDLERFAEEEAEGVSLDGMLEAMDSNAAI